MFCEKCGAENKENYKFCGQCGAPALQAEQEKPGVATTVQPRQIITRKTKLLLAIGSVLAVAIIIFSIWFSTNAEMLSFQADVKDRQYADALAAYKTMDSEDQTKVNKWLIDYISDIEEKYYDGELDYSTTAEILNEIQVFNASYEAAVEASQNVQLDNRSSAAYESAKDLAEKENWLDAYMKIQDIHISYRMYADVAKLREECLTKYKEKVLADIAAYATSEDIKALITARDAALKVLEDDMQIIQAAQTHLDTYVEKTLTDAAAFVAQGDYNSAAELLNYANSIYVHTSFEDAIQTYAYAAAEVHCEALAGQNDLLGAVKYAKELADKNSEYKNLLAKYATPLVTNTLATAKSYADNRQFEQAIATIENVKRVYACSEFESAIEEYNKYTPRKLADCHVIESNEIELGISAEDCFGNEFEHIVGGHTPWSYDISYAVFFLDGRYCNLSGIFVGANTLSNTGQVGCSIYADGVLIYESPLMKRTDNAVEINLDVTNVQQLRIELHGATGAWPHSTSFILDVVVS